MQEKNRFKERVQKQFSAALSWLTGVIVLIFFLRVFEWVYLSLTTDLNGIFKNEMLGFFLDWQQLAPWLFILFIVSFAFSFIRNWLGTAVLLLISLAFLIFQLALVIYFDEALLPLDYSTLATMSSSQIGLILSIYGFTYWHFLLLIPLIIVLLFIWNFGKKLGQFKFVKVATLITLIISLSGFYISDSPSFKSEQTKNLQMNKALLFVNSYFEYYQDLNELLDADMQEVLKRYYAYHPNIDQSDYYKYPFFSTNETENYLGDYFVKSDTAPNVVFIIGESLGRIYSGKGSKLGSFTPFLDSLADEGLYWSNGLANAERTFGAIPNLMAGVPEGRVGFLNLRSSMPNHLSLPLLLKENNNYQTSFFCGADSSFDNMHDYLMFQKFDFIHGIRSFSKNEKLSKILDENGNEKEFNWGAEDLVVFNESMDLMKIDSVSSPFFNLYLTTSFHKPYAHENIEYFENLAEERINSLKPKGYKSYYKKKDAFGALMYMDHSIRECIEAYKKRDDFENTIFVIVGDHSLRMLTNDSRLEKYQVPILIYSPLLTKTGRFQNVVCQKDVPSALQALLRENFNLNLPNFNISQSHNLKTKTNFESTGEHVFMYSGKSMENYLWREYILYEDELFKITENMKLTPIENKGLLDSMLTRLSDYRILSNYVCQKNKYIHKKYYDQYINHKSFLQVNDNFDGAYALDKDYSFVHNVSDKICASSPRSLSSRSESYFKLIENLDITSANRVRLRLKFMISTTQEFPTIYVNVADRKGEITFYKGLQLDQPDCKIRETSSDEWISVETSVWIESTGKPQILNVYFHQKEKQEFFIDNLKIQVKEF